MKLVTPWLAGRVDHLHGIIHLTVVIIAQQVLCVKKKAGFWPAVSYANSAQTLVDPLPGLLIAENAP